MPRLPREYFGKQGMSQFHSVVCRAFALWDDVSHIKMDTYTDLPGIQFYTGNYIKGVTGKSGRIYDRHDAFCLETQCFPDTPNQTAFPTCILEPGQKMKAKTVYSFKI